MFMWFILNCSTIKNKVTKLLKDLSNVFLWCKLNSSTMKGTKLIRISSQMFLWYTIKNKGTKLMTLPLIRLCWVQRLRRVRPTWWSWRWKATTTRKPEYPSVCPKWAAPMCPMWRWGAREEVWVWVFVFLLNSSSPNLFFTGLSKFVRPIF